MTPDVINGLFEFLAGSFIYLHIKQIKKDKAVKGVSIPATAFFTSWGVWNIYFYPSQGLIYSFVGGLFVVVMNFIWLGLMFYYKRKNK